MRAFTNWFSLLLTNRSFHALPTEPSMAMPRRSYTLGPTLAAIVDPAAEMIRIGSNPDPVSTSTERLDGAIEMTNCVRATIDDPPVVSLPEESSGGVVPGTLL